LLLRVTSLLVLLISLSPKRIALWLFSRDGFDEMWRTHVHGV
jgi:hypothetical protein